MTQAFCNLVLHYSVARLSWKTIKSLRRSRSRLRRKKCDQHGYCGNDESQKATPRPMTTHENDEGASPVEYEILQGWTILAFHSLYVSTRVEYFVRFVIPFYFHLKFLVLVVTFVVPSWAGRNGGGDGSSDFGLSPVISYWFDYLIVPGVHRIHEFMDHDPKGWAIQQICLGARLLPLLAIDYFILPGVLTTTDEERQLVRKMRSESSGGDASKAVPPLEAFPPQIPPGQSFPQPMLGHDKQSIIRETENISQSATKETGLFRNVPFIQDSSRKYRKQKVEEPRLTAEQPDDSQCIHTTPPRNQKTSALFHESTPNSTLTPLFPRTAPTNALSPSLSSKKSFNSILSPAVKSRLASSALRLKRFSRDHRSNGDGLLSPNRTPRRGSDASADVNTDEIAKAEETIKRIMESPPKKWSIEDNEIDSSARRTRGKRRERLSLGDHFREIVTGDAKIRVRDHLFDLDLPSSPRRRIRTTRPDQEQTKGRGGTSSSGGSSKRCTARNRVMNEQADHPNDGKNIDAPNVTTRRSSRLAENKVSLGSH